MGLRTLYSLLLAGCLAFITGTPAVCAGHSLMHYSARPDRNTYSGTVLDSGTGEPLIGAAVILKGAKDVAAITDVDGRFEITVESGKEDRIVFEVSYLGYVTTEFSPSGTANLKFLLSPDMNELDEVQVVAYGAQRKVSVTGAITAVNGEQLLKSPSGSAAGSLAGAVSGITTVQASGQPGAEDPVIYVRGTGSLSDAASRPLILVDGVERSFFQMDPHEIESITVLKDASSTAVFGVRGANGVILVTTKRGETGRAKISLTSSFGLTQSLRNLRQVGSYEHASIYSAAQRSDRPDIQDSELTFSPYITELFRTNSDPLMFPSTDWSDYLFKNLAWQTQHNITVSGGMDRVRYFVSLGYLHQDGMLKRLDLNYNPNYLYDRYNYRVNVDVDITSSTVLTLNIGGRVGKRNSPKNDDIWKKLMWCTPYSSPGLVDGMYIFEPNNEYLTIGSGTSGLDLFYNWGYDQNTDNVLNIDLSLNQKLDFITKGLSLNVKGAYNSNYNVYVSRGPTSGNPKVTPFYKGYFTQPGMAIDNPMFDTSIVYRVANQQMAEPLSYSYSSGRGRDWYLEASLNWSRQFGNHEVTALLLYNQSKTYYPSQFIEIPSSYLGYVGRVTYNWKRRYMIDLNAGYNGSENFAPGKRFGLFPAVSAGWVLSEEPWMKDARWLSFLKLRASFGLVGNDKYSGARFMYLANSWNADYSRWRDSTSAGDTGSWQFGTDYNPIMQHGAIENTVGNQSVSWEKVRKQNYGIDLKLFRSRLVFSADVFFENRYDILSTRNTAPSITAIDLPMINLGKVNNHGYELSLGWNSKAGQVEYWVNTNLSFSRNKIIYMDEVVPNYPWMAQTGRSTGLNYLYTFDRYLRADDFDADGNLKTDENGKPLLPVMSLGNPQPGDALFKDLNGDGYINDDDKTYIGYANRPEYVAGLMCGFRWKGLELSMQWTGAWHASRLLSYEYREPFGSTNSRGLLGFLADNSWTVDRQDARFPRITFTNKTHYLIDSDIWLMDASYLRLKNVELSYTLSVPGMKKIGLSSARFFINGYNLLTLCSELAKLDIDPEGTTGKASETSNYPNIRIYNIGFSLTF